MAGVDPRLLGLFLVIITIDSDGEKVGNCRVENGRVESSSKIIEWKGETQKKR